MRQMSMAIVLATLILLSGIAVLADGTPPMVSVRATSQRAMPSCIVEMLTAVNPQPKG